MDSGRLMGAPPIEVVRRLLAGDPSGGVLFFDSGPAAQGTDRWSVICAFPEEILIGRPEGYELRMSGAVVEDPLGWMKARHGAGLAAKLAAGNAPADAPFVGGLAGLLSFEFVYHLDDLRAEHRPLELPYLWVGDYRAAALYSHARQRWYLVGDDEAEGFARLEAVIEEASALPSTTSHFKGAVHDPAPLLAIARETYEAGVVAGIEAIYQGEVFEINYTERFAADWMGTGFELFEALRAYSTGDFGGFLQAEGFCVASISPEQFLEVRRGRARTRPIKGTRCRDVDPARDEALGLELVKSTKDRAENVMIVDLMRNDLTRFCKPGSVEVTGLCELESFEGVHHLVSTVEGELDDGVDALDAFLSAFPAGSITGAPKLRSIELIAALEHGPREAYTGSFFYWSRCGALDSNVLIRTATLKEEKATYGAGGAVVANSRPADEYEEALVKARPFGSVIAEQRRRDG